MSAAMLTIDAAHRSDKAGRATNEDSVAVLLDRRVYLVADGMGGHKGGDMASRLALETVQQAVQANGHPAFDSSDQFHAYLTQLFQQANRAIIDYVYNDLDLLGMGTTLTLAWLQKDQLFFGHTGDSRLYLWRQGHCQQVTQDHTRAQDMVRQGLLEPDEVEQSRHRHVLTRWLGSAQRLEPQLGCIPLVSGDHLLLCSDGLYNEVEPPRLASLLGQDRSAESIAAQLIAAGLENPRPDLDNITALVVRLS